MAELLWRGARGPAGAVEARARKREASMNLMIVARRKERETYRKGENWQFI